MPDILRRFKYYKGDCKMDHIKVTFIYTNLAFKLCDILIAMFQNEFTFVLRGSGNPPRGIPISPAMKSMTELGKDSSPALSSTSCRVSLFCTMNWARSPTTLDDGVTCSKTLYCRTSNKFSQGFSS